MSAKRAQLDGMGRDSSHSHREILSPVSIDGVSARRKSDVRVDCRGPVASVRRCVGASEEIRRRNGGARRAKPLRTHRECCSPHRKEICQRACR
jgi:hypothetical protein